MWSTSKMEEIIGPLMSDTERLTAIKHFFTTEEWNDLVPYQRLVYGRLWENYLVMQKLGLTESKPEFAVKWERKKAASCVAKSSLSHKSLTSPPGGSSASLPKTTTSSSIKKSRKRHPQVLDPDWTPELETLRKTSAAVKNSGKKQNNRPVWPTSNKLLLSDGQAAMFKHFKSIGTFQKGPKRTAKIKMEHNKSEVRPVTSQIKKTECTNYSDILQGMSLLSLEENEKHLGPELKNTLYLSTESTIEAKSEPRYPKRNTTQRKKFIRHLGPQDFQKAEGIFCVACNRKYYTMCLRHPLTLIENTNLPRDGSIPDRIHKSAPFPLQVTDSMLPGAGEGVVTNYGLPAGCVFGPYEGAIVPHVTEENETGYGWEVDEDEESGRTVVDASDPSISNWLAKVNCPNNELEENLVEQYMFGNVFYVTKKIVPSGSELCVYYGDSYAKELGVDKNLANWKCPKKMIQNSKLYREKCKTSMSEISNKKVGPNKQEKKNLSSIFDQRQDNHFIQKRSLKQTMKLESTSGCSTTGSIISDKVGTDALDESPKEIAGDVVCKYCQRWSYSRLDIGFLQEHYKSCVEYRKTIQQQPQQQPQQQHESQANYAKNSHTLNTHQYHHCQHCDYMATTRQNLKRHIMAKHTGEKPHRCPDCDYSATQKDHLKLHIIKHLGDKSKKCLYCDYRATQGSALKRHIMAKHLGKILLKCPECDYEATLKSDLKAHIMVKHTDERPHVCPDCDYRTAIKSNLNIHMAIHKGVRDYRCPQCAYRAIHKGHLNKHINRRHK